MVKNKKVFVLGIDGMPPEKILEWRNELPTISKLMEEGWYSRIRSTIPPTSIAAWSSIFSGLDPGELDIFGYTRKPFPPDFKINLINSTYVKGPRVWDILSKKGKKSIVFGAPLTYPAQPVNDVMITDFLTPGFGSNCVYPEELKKEIVEVLGGPLIFDVSEFANYRNLNSVDLIGKVTTLTEQQFTLAMHFARTKQWDFFAFINYGSDRLHHTLWRYIDSTHKHYEHHPILSPAIKNFYKFLDKKISQLLTCLDDQTTLIVTSDHGMDKMNGRININDWLRQKGLLVLKEDFRQEIEHGPKKINLARIDWSKTKAYAMGAYECFIYINKADREPMGIVNDSEYKKIIDTLSKELKQISDEEGKILNTIIYQPSEVYKPGFSAEAPDLIVYFGNLGWGVNCDVGNKGMYSWANLVGPDDALHAPDGFFIMHNPETKQKGLQPTIDTLWVTPEILRILEV